MRKRALLFVTLVAVLASVAASPQAPARPAGDPVIQKIIDLGTTDNRMYQYLNVTRLRTYGGEGVLPKLFRIEDRAMERTAAKWAEWAANKPSAAEMADFQESVAAEAYEALKKEFADLRRR